MPPRLIRRAPLSERIKSYLDPYDFVLWLAEELNDDAYDEWLKAWSLPIGAGLNVTYILARGAGQETTKGSEDVFGEVDHKSSGWFSSLTTLLTAVLTVACCLNAFYTFFRTRHYRLFEHPVDDPPPTPSAQRVRVDSSPLSSSPWKYLQNLLPSTTAASRAYPDAEREVWEINVWDPRPSSLAIFTWFSPGHILLYYLLLPPAVLDPQPSVTVFLALAFGGLLSLQLNMLKIQFSQQSKDSMLVHGQVMNEYDTKFVRPNLNRPVRDVGVQAGPSSLTPRGVRTREVDVYTPTTIINRGFKPHPNPNYANSYDPDRLSTAQDVTSRRLSYAATVTTPSVNGYSQSVYDANVSTGTSTADFSSPVRPHHEKLRERAPLKGDGASLGVYSHTASPLRKTASNNHLRQENYRQKLDNASAVARRRETTGRF